MTVKVMKLEMKTVVSRKTLRLRVRREKANIPEETNVTKVDLLGLIMRDRVL